MLKNEFLQYVMDNKVITQKVVPKEYNYTKEQKEILLKQFKMK